MSGLYVMGGNQPKKQNYSKGGNKGNKEYKKKGSSKKLTAEQQRKLNEVVTRVNILTILDKEIRPNLPHGYWSSGMRLFETTHVDLCPLHAEDTGSFRVFPATNTCYCYAGCGGGDGVWLYREFNSKALNNDISFTSAIEYLYSTYIDGKKAAPVIFNDLMKTFQINDSKEVFTFFFKLTTLERNLQTKKTGISLDKLLDYYERVDRLKRLMSNNEIKAEDAMNELNNAYTEVLKK